MDKKLKIAVNTRLLLRDKLEGIGYFTAETLKPIVANHPEIEFHFLFDRPFSDEFIFGSNVRPVVLQPPARHPLLWYLWLEWSVANYLRKHQFDLFLSPDGFCSLRSDTPTVAVQHDIAFEHYPSFTPSVYSRYYRFFVPRFVAHAARVATVSEYSKTDLVKHYGTDPGKIDVVYNAAKEIFRPLEETEKEKIKHKYTNGRPYFIYVGSVHPRKNLKNMLLAFDLFRQTTVNAEFVFIVAGAFGWQNSELKTVIENMQFRKDVLILGRQPLEELSRLIASSYALMYVSLFEGFGVPPLEGMQSAVPVITSGTSSMPEICGEAALLVDPLNEVEISAAMQKLYAEPELYRRLVQKGPEQAALFSWQKSADLLWQSCEKALADNRHPLQQ